MYSPKYLKLWTRLDNYAGATWEGYYLAGFGQSRDSDALERSNFRVAREAILTASGHAETQVIREHHWAVGWVEWIAIHPEDTEALKVADQLSEKMESYPVLDEDNFSEIEMNAYEKGFDRGNYGNAYENQDWETWYAEQCVENAVDSAAAFDYTEGMLLGFFSSYEIHEISDEVIAETVANLRNKWGTK